MFGIVGPRGFFLCSWNHLCTPILQRRKPEVFFDVFAKKTNIGEIQLEGDFLHREVGLQKVVFDMVHRVFGDQVLKSMAVRPLFSLQTALRYLGVTNSCSA